MIRKPIGDTGVIIAYLDKRDKWHKWTLEQMRVLPIPFSTCEAVITEACFLAQHLPNGESDVLRMLNEGVLEIDFSLRDEAQAIQTLMSKYKDLPMDFADACLVRMSELIKNSVVFTVDSDFHIYRKNSRQKIDLIIP